MSPPKKSEIRKSVAIFYSLNKEKGKQYTVTHFKGSGLSRRALFYILKTFDDRGNVDRKSGSGRKPVLTKQQQKTLLKKVKNKAL